MKNLGGSVLVAAAVAASLGTATLASAQNAAITNVRIIVGNGPVIESGTLVVRDGKIASVGTGKVDTKGLVVIDGKGLTALPGFIDDHKHINTGPLEKEQMQSLLEAGYTTILSAGGPGDGNLTLREHIESGLINGPRIIPSERVNLRSTPDEARAAVRAMAAKGIHMTGEIALTPEPAPPQAEMEVIKAVVDEAKKQGVQVNIHAVSTPAMIAAIEAGVTRLVHLPNKDWTGFDQAAQVAATHSIVAGLNAFGAPIIDRESPPPAPVQFPKDDSPRFRDGKPWPEAIAGANRDPKGRAMGTEAGYTIVNARRIWDADHGALSWSTDQNYADKVVLEHELKSFSVMFSMADIFQIMGPNSANYIGMADKIGTLEVGKYGDITLVQGDPRENIYPLLNTTVVLKEGKVVVDKRVKGKKG
jgi:imidazolonepropionase-like amidohydrolase